VPSTDGQYAQGITAYDERQTTGMKHRSTLQDILERPVNVTKLLEKLDFADEAVIGAAREQAQLFLEAARLRIQKMRERVEAESQLALVKSELSIKIRHKAVTRGDKITEGHVAARLAKNSQVIEAQEKFNRAEEEEEFSKLLVEAFRMRRDAEKIVGDLIGAEVYVARQQEGHESLTKIREKLSAKYPGQRMARVK
jgi:hypothetical protein